MGCAMGFLWNGASAAVPTAAVRRYGRWPYASPRGAMAGGHTRRDARSRADAVPAPVRTAT